ncbi:MAG TPA: acetaldehyde dehydrogenase (acetylating) [Trebonia sp.]|nr:acetaldehyde dehydrogenase (acetylating) [Trebonia sp.]
MTRAVTSAAVIGSGNIGTDLMIKLLRGAGPLRMRAMAGIDPASEGLAHAARLGVATTADGVEGLLALPDFGDLAVVFDATSASAHVANAKALAPYDVRVVDLTPAALGPFVVPAVNLGAHRDAREVNMVTCGGQATIPIVAAVASVAQVAYAEIVASISSRSAGPGTRANIDEFTETTASAIETVGGARRGKAVIILNPAEPPLIMRDTVYCLVAAPGTATRTAIAEAVTRMVADVASYVPGYRLKQPVQVTEADGDVATRLASEGVTHQVTVMLEVEGAGHYLPPYAGNLDIMTSAAVRTGERLATP